MNFRLSMIALCILLLANTASASTSSCARVKAQPDAWVKAKIDALVEAARAAYDRDQAQKNYERVLDDIAGTIRQCKLAQDEGFAARYREFVDYIEAVSLDRQPDHELGFTVPDAQYFEETRQYVQIPEFLMAQSFIRAVSRYETLEQAKSFLQKLNSTRAPSEQLIFFSYTSRHLGTPDNDDSYRRLLVVVPGNSSQGIPEKWVQFGITDPGVRARTRNVSVVSTLLNPDGTNNTYFKDYYRTYARNGSISIKGRWELGYGDDNCAQCHKSGILPIFPEEGSVKASEKQAVAAVNQRFLTYGSPRFDKYLDETKFGPGLSSASMEDREHRFGASFGGTVVAHAMSCAACHHPERLGYLNWPMDRVVISSYIKGGQMPFGYELHATERSELYRKLIQEYFATDAAHPGILKSWLLGKLRQSNPPKSQPSNTTFDLLSASTHFPFN